MPKDMKQAASWKRWGETAVSYVEVHLIQSFAIAFTAYLLSTLHHSLLPIIPLNRIPSPILDDFRCLVDE